MAVDSRVDQTAIVGRSGCGKSHYVKQWLDAYLARERPRLLIWSPLEATDKYARWGVVIREDVRRLLGALAKAKDGFRFVYVPDRKRLMVEQFEAFCSAALALGKREPVAVVVEELSLVTRAGSSTPSWRMISTEGRHHGIASIGTTQRPALVDKTYLGGASIVRCGALQYRGDKVAMADILDCQLTDLRSLRPGEFLVLSAYTGEVTREGRPIAQLEEKPAPKSKKPR